jgi:hypothetical protein
MPATEPTRMAAEAALDTRLSRSRTMMALAGGFAVDDLTARPTRESVVGLAVRMNSQVCPVRPRSERRAEPEGNPAVG